MDGTDIDSAPPVQDTGGSGADPAFNPNDPNTWPMGDDGEAAESDVSENEDDEDPGDVDGSDGDDAPPMKKNKKPGKSETEKSNGFNFLLNNKEAIKMRNKEGGIVSDAEMPPIGSVRPARDYGGASGGGGTHMTFGDDVYEEDEDDEDEDEDDEDDESDGMTAKERRLEKAEAEKRRKIAREERWEDNMREIQTAHYENCLYGPSRRTGLVAFHFITPELVAQLNTLPYEDVEMYRRRIDGARQAAEGLQTFMDGASLVQLAMTAAGHLIESQAVKRGWMLQGYGDTVSARAAADIPLCGRVYRRQIRPLVTMIFGEQGESLLSDGTAVGMLFINSAVETHRMNKAAKAAEEAAAASVAAARASARPVNVANSGATGYEQSVSAGVQDIPPTVQEVQNAEYMKQWGMAVKFDPSNGATATASPVDGE